MPKSPAQSELVYRSPEVDHDDDMATNGASPTATKWIYVVAGVLVFVLFVLAAVALHIPRGESP
jgi:hypothetical protein